MWEARTPPGRSAAVVIIVPANWGGNSINIYNIYIRFAVRQDGFDFFFMPLCSERLKVFEERDTSVLHKSILQHFPIMQLFGSPGRDFRITAVVIKCVTLQREFRQKNKVHKLRKNPENNLHKLQNETEPTEATGVLCMQ